MIIDSTNHKRTRHGAVCVSACTDVPPRMRRPLTHVQGLASCNSAFGHILPAKMSEKVVNGTTAYLHPASKMVMSASNDEKSNGIHPNPVSKMAANASNGEMSSCFKPCRPVDTSASNGDTSRCNASNGDTNSHNFSSPLPEQVADLSVSFAQLPSPHV